VTVELKSVEADMPNDSETNIQDTTDPSSIMEFIREVAFAPSLAPPREDHAWTGETIGRFKITELLGRGGMGAVYAAIDLTLKRKVALKLLHQAAVATEEQRRRFLQEARAAAAVNHPNIATVFDIGEVGGIVFIAMEWVDGRQLRAVMQAGDVPLAEATAVDIARGIAAGLAAAHDVGLSHRDIKPENVMITHKGIVKLVDFGLAKLHNARFDPDVVGSTDVATREGSLLGTTSYMSPEQARRYPADSRSDVFAFGILLFEMLTLRRPFHGATEIDVLAAIIRDAPPRLHDLRDGADGHLASIVSRCLEKDPIKRYAHAGELLAALETIAPSSRPARLSRSWIRRSPWIALPIVGMVALTIRTLLHPKPDFAVPSTSPTTSAPSAPPTLPPTDLLSPKTVPTSSSASVVTPPKQQLASNRLRATTSPLAVAAPPTPTPPVSVTAPPAPPAPIASHRDPR
jgi:serine/threonine protein kinase